MHSKVEDHYTIIAKLTFQQEHRYIRQYLISKSIRFEGKERNPKFGLRYSREYIYIYDSRELAQSRLNK